MVDVKKGMKVKNTLLKQTVKAKPPLKSKT